jgi:hypothetical protein
MDASKLANIRANSMGKIMRILAVDQTCDMTFSETNFLYAKGWSGFQCKMIPFFCVV